MSNVTDTSELIPDKLDRNIITAIMYNNFFTNDNAALRSENEAFHKSDSDLKQCVTNLKKQLRELRNQ